MHPTESLKATKGRELLGKKIVLGITGSIAAVESFELARELIRHGAEVHAVLSESAAKLVTPWIMEFATGNPVIEVIDGKVQHVAFFGDHPQKADLLLISPCTANTLSKIACGIADTPVNTMAMVALGTATPIMMAPAMNLAMYHNPMVQANFGRLLGAGVETIGPRVEGKKAKVAETDEIVERVIRRLGKRDLHGSRILIIGGSSEEPIDAMRIITNRGSGETGVALARAAFERGAEVELWMGRCQVTIPSFMPLKRFNTVEDLMGMAASIDHDIVIVPAALSDYAPERAKGKLSSKKATRTIQLKCLPKVVDVIATRKVRLVTFKAEHGVDESELARCAKERLDKGQVEFVVANDLASVGAKETKAFIVRKDGSRTRFEGSKTDLAHLVLDELVQGG